MFKFVNNKLIHATETQNQIRPSMSDCQLREWIMLSILPFRARPIGAPNEQNVSLLNCAFVGLVSITLVATLFDG
jgi:hypothetical protein